MSDVEKIEILGPGCARCKETCRVIQQVVAEANLDVEVVKDDSIDRMAQLGVMVTPAVVVDGEVKISGRIPAPALVRKVLGIKA